MSLLMYVGVGVDVYSMSDVLDVIYWMKLFTLIKKKLPNEIIEFNKLWIPHCQLNFISRRILSCNAKVQLVIRTF